MDGILSPSRLFTGLSNSMPQLSSLDLSGSTCLLGAADEFTSLRGMTQLQQLQLARILFKAGDLQFMAQLPVTAINISLSEPGSAPAAITWLSESGSKLDFLMLEADNSSGPAMHGAQLLESVCKGCPALTGLLLKELNLHSSASPASQPLYKLTQLRSLGLARCDMNAAALWSLSALSGLQSLCLFLRRDDHSVLQTPGCMQCLAASLVQLTALCFFSGCTEAVNAGFGARVLEERQEGGTTGFALKKAESAEVAS